MKATGSMKVLAVVLIAAVFLLSATSLSAGVSLKSGASQYNWYQLTSSTNKIPYTSYPTYWVVGSQFPQSKLIVNQPSGAVDVAITGELNGLVPGGQYSVYLSNPWYYGVTTTWTIYDTVVTSPNTITVGQTYPHTLTFSSESIDYGTGTVSFSGTFSGGTITDGVITGNAVTWTFNQGATYKASFTGTIGLNGVISGTWTSNAEETGTFYTSPDAAATGWQYSFTGSNRLPGDTFLTPFTVTADSTGSLSWHINLVDSDFTSGSGTYLMSVWINYDSQSVFISDSFSVTVAIS